jgi:hypothetical protein
MSAGNIFIPRSLFSDPLWNSFSSEEKEFAFEILARVCFKSQKFDDHGVIINLAPGEICASIREMASWIYGRKNFKSIKNGKKVDNFDSVTTFVERSLTKFKKVNFCRQEVRHLKSVITVTYPIICEAMKFQIETENETLLRQDRDRFETQKKNVKKGKNVKEKEEKEKDGADAPVASAEAEQLLNFIFYELQKRDPGRQKPEGVSRRSWLIGLDYILKNRKLDFVKQVMLFALNHKYYSGKINKIGTLKTEFATITQSFYAEKTSSNSTIPSRARKDENGIKTQSQYDNLF